MRSFRILAAILCVGVLFNSPAWAEDTQGRLRALEDAYRNGIISAQEYQQKRAAIEAGSANSPEKQRRMQALEQARQAGVISERDYQRKRAEILGESSRPSHFTPGSEYESNGWLLNGDTLGHGNSGLLARFGFPGLQVAVSHGVADKIDIGGEFQFTYAPLGIANSVNVGTVGLAIGPMFKLNIARSDTFNFGTRFTPSFLIAFATNTAFALLLPLDFLAGVTISPEFSLNFGLKLPLAMQLNNGFVFYLPILPTVGVEYRVLPELSIGLDTAFGPAIGIASGGSATSFAFNALVSIGYYF